MEQLKNILALFLFDLVALARGYCFVKAATAAHHTDMNNVYGEEGFQFPDELKDKVRSYKEGTINFVAYHKGTPVGMVRLADPDVINRPYELYGVDMEGEHYEIQSLLVKKEHRDGTQFVMLGLFKAMYAYSIRHDISSWSSCGARSVYLTMKRYCRKIEVEEVDFATIMHPLTQYLYTNKIIDTYFTMSVNSFEPWPILKRFVKQLAKKIQLPDLSISKRINYASLNYRGK